jgi:hypothetical protein
MHVVDEEPRCPKGLDCCSHRKLIIFDKGYICAGVLRKGRRGPDEICICSANRSPDGFTDEFRMDLTPVVFAAICAAGNEMLMKWMLEFEPYAKWRRRRTHE